MREHPKTTELMSYAEGLVDRGATLESATAAHIAQCPACAKEVESIRTSLEWTRKAEDVEPSPEFKAKVLLASQYERRVAARADFQRKVAMATGKVAAAATLVTLLAWYAISEKNVTPVEAVQTSHKTHAGVGDNPVRMSSIEDVRRTAREVKTLAAAVDSSHRAPRSYREEVRWRAVTSFDEDITFALAALEQNPQCVRASRMVYANLQRQAKALRSLYVERSH